MTNGRDVYVAGPGGNAITHLTRGLTVRGEGAADGVYALALRGRTLYAAAPGTAALSTFRVGSSRGTTRR